MNYKILEVLLKVIFLVSTEIVVLIGNCCFDRFLRVCDSGSEDAECWIHFKRSDTKVTQSAGPHVSLIDNCLNNIH